MFRLRIKYEKKGWSRFVSQLEMVKVMERTLRRGDFPLAFTEGFNPRPRLSFGPPTPVGFESQAELVEVFLTTRLPESTVKKKLERFFPEGFKPLNVSYVSLSEVSLMKKMLFSEYEVRFPLLSEYDIGLQKRLEDYLSTVYELVFRGKLIRVEKEKDFPEFLVTINGGCVNLKLLLAVREDKTIRPDVLLFNFLKEENLSLSELRVLRKELFFQSNGRLVKVV